MYYAEQKNFHGAWYPVLLAELPVKRRAEGSIVNYRNIREIPDAYRHLSLDELSAIYGDPSK